MRLYLLRHGEVTSYKGDVPITAHAERQARAVGQALARGEQQPIAVLSGDTRRTIDTAAHLARGVVDAGGDLVGPDVAFALRNPDLYVAGTRVNMVNTPEALADQVAGLSPEDVPTLDFFPVFMASPDRIGWWLTHESPPGEDAAAVAARVRSFAASLVDPVPAMPQVVVAVTHSPLVRAVALDLLGSDIGEPPWIAGLVVTVEGDAEMSLDGFGMEIR